MKVGKIKAGGREGGKEGRSIRERERYEEGATEPSVGESHESWRYEKEREREHKGDPKSKSSQLWLLRLGRMRVLGRCGISSPPDKRQFSSVNSIRNTIADGGRGAGSGSPARTFLESAGSFARGSGRIARDGRSPWSPRSPRSPRDHRIVAAGTCPIAREQIKFPRSTCLSTLGELARTRLRAPCARRAPGTRPLPYGR